MPYRDDLEVLQMRIEELEQRVVELRGRRDQINAAMNLGPEAPHWISKLMYRLGRAVGRRLAPKPAAADPRAIEAARERIQLLERRSGILEEEIASAAQQVLEAREAEERAAREREDS